MISVEDFEALPPSIQKKYFSSLERLRITQQSAAHKRRRRSPKTTRLQSMSSAATNVRPKTSDGFHSTPPCPRSRQRLSKRAHVEEAPVPKDQAWWFLTLPDKIKRQYFSREEQVLLTASCESSLACASPDLAEEVSQCRLTVDRPEDSSCIPRRLSTASASDIGGSHGIECYLETDTLSLQSVESVDAAMEILKLYSRRRHSAATNKNSLPSPLPPLPPTGVILKPSKTRSFRRSFSLTPLPLPPPTLAPVPRVPSPVKLRELSDSAKSHHHNAKPLPEAKYYQDKDARKTLRQYATPQKFDEALEFGFPSSELTAPGSSGSDRSEPARNVSLTYSADGDADSLSSQGPTTPTACTISHEPTIAQTPSVDSGVGLPLQLNLPEKTAVDRSRSSSFNTREMTLRMTLTRPELRAPEEELCRRQRKQFLGVEIEHVDPLALEPLTVSEDSTGANGAFAVTAAGQEKGLRRVWRSLRLKG